MKVLKYAASLLVLLAALALGPAPALAVNCVPYTYTLTNGTTADANQVMADFNTIRDCANNNLAHNGANSDITSLSGLVTPLSVPQGGTGLGTLTIHAVPIGNAASTINFATVGTAGNVLTDNGAAADPTFQAPVTSNKFTNSLSGDVSLNNAANYFDGPSVAQGATGTWLATGTVTIADTANTGAFSVKLWDGTTVIASALITLPTANQVSTVSLSGYIVAPAGGNIRISVKDSGDTTGVIKFNNSGNSKDSTVSVVRIQ